jgi:tetratricopeptide (TPR) repeat protein
VPVYKDFEIEITSNEKFEFFGKVLNSPGGTSPRCQLKLPFANDPKDIEIQRLRLENAILLGDNRGSTGGGQFRGPASPSEQVIRDFGSCLFRGIFVEPGPIRDVYSQSKGIVGSDSEEVELRIKLRITTPELASLPWEYLYDDNDMPQFLSLKLPVVRYFEWTGSTRRMEVKGPLRILGMIANPASSEWPRLDEPAERRRISQAVDPLERDGRIHFEWVTGGTGTDLMTKLMEGEWHVFHFIGHGGYEDPSGASGDDDTGFIVLLDEYGNPDKKFSSDLATLLVAQKKSLRLAVLNCCESARTNVRSQLGSPAAALMRSGLPAVVAMQYKIGDKAAINLAEGFYRALSNNQPVDQAITAARGFIQNSSRIEWGVPVLYMRSTDGRIFEVSNPKSSTAAGEAADGLASRLSAADGTKKQAATPETDEKFAEFMLHSELSQASSEELQRLTTLGQELLGRWKGNPGLSRRLAAIYCEVGARQQRQSEVTNAIASFGYAIQLDPSRPQYWSRRANLSVRIGLFEKSLSDISEAIKLEPENGENYWIKGIILSMAAGPDNNSGRIDEAIHAFNVAIGKNPQEARYRLSRANLLIRANRPDEAFADIDVAESLGLDVPSGPAAQQH